MQFKYSAVKKKPLCCLSLVTFRTHSRIKKEVPLKAVKELHARVCVSLSSGITTERACMFCRQEVLTAALPLVSTRRLSSHCVSEAQTDFYHANIISSSDRRHCTQCLCFQYKNPSEHISQEVRSRLNKGRTALIVCVCVCVPDGHVSLQPGDVHLQSPLEGPQCVLWRQLQHTHQ